MADLKAPKRNAVIGRLADILQSGKDTANQYQILPQVPLIGGTGLGDMFMGKAPELVDDISYDGLQAAIRGGNVATGGIGTYGARPAVADAALLGLDVAGVGKGLGGLSRRSASALYDKLIEGGTSLSRREALKKLGALSGGAAVTGGTFGAARKLLDNVATDVAPKIADNVAVQAAKKYKFNTLAEYLDDVKMRTDEHMWDNYDPPNVTSYKGHPDYDVDVAAWDKNYKKAYTNHLTNDEAAYVEHKARVGRGEKPVPWSIEHNPKTNQYESIAQDEVLSPVAKQDLKTFKTNVQDLHDSYIGDGGKADWASWIANKHSSENGAMGIDRIISGEF